MAGVRYDDHVWKAAANVPAGAEAPLYSVPRATVQVVTTASVGTPSPVNVPIFSDEAMTVALPNPLTTDQEGNYGFFVAPGTYAAVVRSASGQLLDTYTITTGLTGADGVSPTIAVGAVTTGAPGSDAVFENVGTPEAAVFDVTLPTGAVGPPTTFSGAYNAGTTYAHGLAVSLNGASYVSLQDANVGHSPDVSPSWWGLQAKAGDGFTDRGAWAAFTSYLPRDVFSAPDGSSYRVLTAFTSGSSFTVTGALALNGRAGTDGSTTPNFTDQVTFPSALVGARFDPGATAMGSAASDRGVASVGDKQGFVVFRVDKVTGQTQVYFLKAGTVQADALEIAVASAPLVLVGAAGPGQTALASDLSDSGLVTVGDKNGFIVFKIDKATGITRIASLVADAFSVAELDAPSILIGDAGAQFLIRSSVGDLKFLSVADKNGFIILSIDKVTGHIQVAALDVNLANITTLNVQKLNISSPTPLAGVRGLTLDYELMYFMIFGQSLSLGTDSISAVSLAQLWDSVMFNGGVISQASSTNGGDDPTLRASLIPLVEQNWEPAPNGAFLGNPTNWMGETPMSGALETIKGILAAENNLMPGDKPYRFIGSTPGRGGTNIANLSKGTPPYSRVIAEATAAASIAATQKKIFGIPAGGWVQGENDVTAVFGTTQAQYVTAGTQLLGPTGDLNTDLKAISGQSKTIEFYIAQTFAGTSSYGPTAFNIANAQYILATTLANVRIATPLYPIQNASSGDVHLSPAGSKQLGGYIGKMFKRRIVDGVDYNPMMPLSFRVIGGTRILLTVSLDETPIVIDTTNYTSQNGARPNAGFTLWDSSNNPVTISSVSIAGQNVIEIDSSVTIAPGSGYQLRYGYSTDGVLAGGGNIRDNQGFIDTVNVPGVGSMPLHNWLRVFSHTF